MNKYVLQLLKKFAGIDIDAIMQGAAEVISYGTAVKFVNK